MLKTYILTAKSNNDDCVLVNGAETIELKEKSIIDKIKKNEIKVLNKELQKVGRKNVLVDIPYNGVLSEQILFDIYLGKIISFNNFEDEILFIILNKIKSLFYRTQDLRENRLLFEHCILLLKRYFNYMGETDVKMAFIKKDLGISFKNKGAKTGDVRREEVFQYCKDKFDSYLIHYREPNVPNSDIEKWYNNSTNVLFYRCFLEILKNVYRSKNVDEFNAVYSILSKFFNEIDYTLLGGYLFAAYSNNLMRVINSEISPNNSSFQGFEVEFKRLNDDERAEEAKKCISVTNKALYEYKMKLKDMSDSYESLVKRYDKTVISLLTNLNSNSFNDKNKESENEIPVINQNIDKEKLYSYYLEISTSQTCELISKFNNFISKKIGIKDYTSLLKLFDYSKKISEFVEIPVLNGISTGGKVACEIATEVHKEVKKSRNKYLGPYSKEFIENFQNCNSCEIDILSFLLDVRRAHIIKKENKKRERFFMKPIFWSPTYCKPELKPMAEIYCNDLEDSYNVLRASLSENMANSLVISWLSSYNFFHSCVRSNSAVAMDYNFLYFYIVRELMIKVHLSQNEIQKGIFQDLVVSRLIYRLSQNPFNWNLTNHCNTDIRDMLKDVNEYERGRKVINLV